MDKELSEESKGLLRDMTRSEAWRIYEAIQNERIKDLRVLATQRTTSSEDKHWFSGEAQGRENAIYELKDKLYDSGTKS